MEKITLYKKTGDIALADVKKICAKEAYYNIFDIINLIIENKIPLAIDIFNRMAKNDPYSLMKFVTIWYKHLENVLYIKNSNKSDYELSTALKLPPFIISKNFRGHSNILENKTIISGLNYLTDIDYKIRKGSFNIKNYLDNFILKFMGGMNGH